MTRLARSHDAERPEVPRIGVKNGELRDELPPPSDTALTVADRDPSTGRFVKGTQAARRRSAKALAKALPGLDPSKCAPWLAPFATLAAQHAVELVASLPTHTPALAALATSTAAALGVERALLALGATGDMEALKEARAWAREHRQSLVTLTALSRETKAPPSAADTPWFVTDDTKDGAK